MKIRMTTSFFYSLFLHLMILILGFLLFWSVRNDAEPVREKRCKIMLNQVCECPPVKAAETPKAEKEKKQKPEKKAAGTEPQKSKPAPVVEEKVVLQAAPEVKEPENDMERADEPSHEVAEEEVRSATEADQPKETIVTSAEELAHPPVAKKTVELPTEEHVSPEDAYIEAHLSEIMALLRENLYYPRMARKRHIEGEVTVRFVLLKNGEIEDITVVKAERDILARSAVTTIERLDGKFPFPTERLVLNVPIAYQLH